MLVVAGSVEEVPPDGAVFFFTPFVRPNWPCTLKICV
jgi:hypothetical protein